MLSLQRSPSPTASPSPTVTPALQRQLGWTSSIHGRREMTNVLGLSGWRQPSKDEALSLFASGAANGQGWANGYLWISDRILACIRIRARSLRTAWWWELKAAVTRALPTSLAVLSAQDALRARCLDALGRAYARNHASARSPSDMMLDVCRRAARAS